MSTTVHPKQLHITIDIHILAFIWNKKSIEICLFRLVMSDISTYDEHDVEKQTRDVINVPHLKHITLF